MLAINIALVIVGAAIPIGTTVLWSRAAKMLNCRFENKSYGKSAISERVTSNLIRWIFYHRSKFNIIIAAIVTVIEFFALMPF